MGAGEVAVEARVGQAGGVDHRGIGIQPPGRLAGQTVVEDAGDLRPLLRRAGFFFDDACEGHELAIIELPRPTSAQAHHLGQGVLGVGEHEGEKVLGGQAAADFVGLGKQEALAAGAGHLMGGQKSRIVAQGVELFGREPATRHQQVAHGPAVEPLSEGKRLQRHLAGVQHGQQLQRCFRAAQLVAAAAHRRQAARPGVEVEQPRVAQAPLHL